MKTYQNNFELFQFIIRTPKEDSAFLYFNLESHEGISFYNTIDYQVHSTHRDIEIMGSIEFRPDFLHLLDHIRNYISYEILRDSMIYENDSLLNR